MGLTIGLLVLTESTALGLQPEADKKVMEGLEAGYSFDFERSSQAFAEADRLDPRHPAGPFFLASLTWLEFSLNSDVPGTGAVLEPKFEAFLAEAFRRARKMTDDDPKSAEAHFYLGAAYGMRGRWKIVKRQWVRAATDGWKSYKYLRRTVELDPRLYDAYLGLGMYDYYSDALPTVLKIASSLIVRGDKRRGLHYVTMAIEKGHFSVLEGQIFLVGVYTAFEKEPERALDIIRDMRLERSDNLFLLYLEIAARHRAKDWRGAIAAGEALVAKSRSVPYAFPHLPIFELYLADAYIGAKDYAKAREVADRCVFQAPDPRRGTVTFCRLRRAQADDLLGLRKEALADYAVVEGRSDFWDSRKKAELGLKEPATYDRVLGELLE